MRHIHIRSKCNWCNGRNGINGHENFRARLLIILILSLPLSIAPINIVPTSSYAADRDFIDHMGRSMTIPENPERLISLAPNITEILFALGAGERVVGVTEFSNYPIDTILIPKIGTYIKPNLERIVEIGPDLVIATADGDKEPQVRKLDSLGIPVYVVNPENMGEIIETIRVIGELIGNEDEASILIGEMEGRIEEITRKVSGRGRVKVLMELGFEPLITISSNTFQDDIINLAGGINIAAGEKVRYPRFGVEDVIARAPEVIVIPAMGTGEDRQMMIDRWMRWEIIPAVKDKRVFLIDPDIINRPSYRIVEGLEALARLLHPGAFEDLGGHDGD